MLCYNYNYILNYIHSFVIIQILENTIEPYSDIWALGVVFYELFFGIYMDMKTAKNIGLYDSEKRGYLIVDKTLIKDSIQSEIASLIKKMTKFEPNSRISPIEI